MTVSLVVLMTVSLSVLLTFIVKVDVEGDDDESTEQPTDETVKTEHEVSDAQQVDAAQGVAGTSDEQHGKEVCACQQHVYFQ